MTVERLRWKFLTDAEAEELYKTNQRLSLGPDEYCPTCEKKGTYFWQGESRECDCQLQLQLHKHYLNAGIGKTYQRLSWDDYSGDEEAKKLCGTYLESSEAFISRGMGLVFIGDYGTGKTMALNLLMKDLVVSGYRCFATTFTNMIDMFTAGWRSADEQQKFQDRVRGSDILLLDDIGKELKTKNNLSESTFDSVLRFRVQNGKPTFITTNMTYDELREGYGGAIFSLMGETSVVHKLEGKDFRPQSADRLLVETQQGITRPIQ